MTLRSLPRFAMVTYRSAGDDWLTYESFARSILETWSLEGGEPLFFYQPLFRYIRFAQHFLLGDGDAFFAILDLACLNWAVFWLAGRLWPRRGLPWPGTALFAAPGLLLLALVNSATVVSFLQAGLSEVHTWMFLPLALPLLLVSRSTRAWLGGTALLGLSFLARTDQAPGVLALFLVFGWRALRARPRALRAVAGTGLLLAAMALLPSAHNLYYGRRLVSLPTSGQVQDNLVLRPARLPTLLRDAEARARAGDRVRGMFYLIPSREGLLHVALRGLQVAWALAPVALLVRARRAAATAWALWLVPFCYLGIYLFYELRVYYPRHVLIGYVAMGAAAMYAARAAGGRPATSRRTGG